MCEWSVVKCSRLVGVLVGEQSQHKYHEINIVYRNYTLHNVGSGEELEGEF